MIRVAELVEMPPLVVRLPPQLDLSDEQFFELCQANHELRFERTAAGELVIMAPAGGESGRRNFNLNLSLGNWARGDGSGVGFDSSAGFRLPGGAVRAPDAAWVRRDRWDALSPAQRERFVPLCPDFVAEILSPADDIEDAQAKMAEFVESGCRLGWLIDPFRRRVFVYRPGVQPEVLTDPPQLRGDPVLPGFVLDLADIL